MYNLGAQSHVGVFLKIQSPPLEVTGIGTLRLLEAIRFLKMKKTKFYQASTSELFGETYGKKYLLKNLNFIQNLLMVLQNYTLIGSLQFTENLMAYLPLMVFPLFNHESPRRGETFVTRKITRFLARKNWVQKIHCI